MSLVSNAHHDRLLRYGLLSEITSTPLHVHLCYGYGGVLCPFGLRAGMHAEEAWTTICVADLSVGG